MIKPSDCVINPNKDREHLNVINGDVKQCELCGQLWVYKENLWQKKK